METDSDQITFGQITGQTGAPFSSASLNGNYGLDLTGIDGRGAETDFVGQFSSSGTSTLTGGTLDINDQDFSPSTFPNNAVSGGAYTVVSSTTGHATVTFTVAGAALAFSTYVVSPNLSFWIEADNDFLSAGTSQSQPVIP